MRFAGEHALAGGAQIDDAGEFHQVTGGQAHGLEDEEVFKRIGDDGEHFWLARGGWNC